MNQEEKERLVAKAHQENERMFGWVYSSQSSLCLARSFLAVAEKAGYTQFVIQGGSAFFKYQRGRSTEMYGYEYDEVKVLTEIKRDGVPIMHVWVADTSEGQEGVIIDLSTGIQPRIAMDCGIKWLPSLMPDAWFWGKPNAHRAIYVADEFATKLAYILAIGLTK